MFHALVSDSKQQADSAKANPSPQKRGWRPTFDESRAPGMQPAHLQRAYGNQAVLRMMKLSRPSVQPKLVINEPGDAYEQEADRIAGQVMRMPDPGLSIASAPAQLSRKCAACEEEEKAKKLQMKPAGSAGAAPGEAPPIVHEVLRSPGHPLDPSARAFFEPRFGLDLGHVRLHDDAQAALSARAVGARAFTVGGHIIFADNVDTVSESGRRLLAHELAHTIQPSAASDEAQHLPQSPTGSGASSQIRGDRTTRHAGSVDHAVAQCQPDASQPGVDEVQKSLPAGAPAVFVDDFDPVLGEETTVPPQTATASSVQTSIQRSVASSVTIQRQPAPPTAAAGAPPAVAQTLSWSDFPLVPNRIDGASAQTGVRRSWRNDGTGFTVAFEPAQSWSVAADQTDALLRHEQYHLNLAVLIANKANAAAGTMRAAALIDAFKTALRTHDRSYDQDTDHSRNTRLQTMWEQDIDAGVPEFPITP